MIRAAVMALLLALAADAASAQPDPQVRAAIVAGQPPARPAAAPAAPPRAGDVSLNFPGVDVHEAARTILGDMLGLGYVPDPGVHGQVSVVTARPIARSDVLPFFETALKTSGFVLVRRAGGYTILARQNARSGAQLLSPQESGFGNELLQLQFVNAQQMKKLIDQLLPNNAIAQVDPQRNMLMVSGDEQDRRAVRDLVRQFDVNWLRGMSFALFTPQRTDSRLIAPELDKLINAPGSPTAGLVRLISMDRLHGILAITAQPQYLEDVRRWVEILDREGESSEARLFVYPVQNGRSTDLAKVLVSALGGALAKPAGQAHAQDTAGHPDNTPQDGLFTAPSPPQTPAAAPAQTGEGQAASSSQTVQFGDGAGPATITSDDTNNAIVVFATPRQYALIEDALQKLDVVPLQVVIEAAITEVTLNKDLNYGVQWYFRSANSTFTLSQADTGLPTQNFPGFSYLYANGLNTITATLNALSNITDIKVISAPKLMVLNNHTATLQVGDQVPVATESSISTVTPNAPIVNSIEYKDTGVILTVTPRVNSSGLVLLDISQEVSDVSTTASSKIDSPTIQQRRISSSIAVNDGQTIALGGLIRDARTHGSNGVPVLSRVPVLGALFGDKTDQGKRTELLVLLTPHVIRTAADAATITEDLRRRLPLAGATAPTDPIKP